MMETSPNYVVQSLELHLFFARIMKEHSLFLKAGFTPVNAASAKEAEFFKKEFERLLSQAVTLSNGIIGSDVLNSGELFTEFTARAEQQTERFTGIPIAKEITAREMQLRSGNRIAISQELFRQIRAMNRTAINLLNGLIALKEGILDSVLRCRMFTMNYPLLLEHIIREAKLYRSYVLNLEQSGTLDGQSMLQIEQFWNQIMMEHALFIRGLLDPAENELVDTANNFAKEYAQLLNASISAHNKTISGGSLTETLKFRDFKAAGAKGISECKIRSIILPLLADHVLREANHYIRLLDE